MPPPDNCTYFQSDFRLGHQIADKEDQITTNHCGYRVDECACGFSIVQNFPIIVIIDEKKVTDIRRLKGEEGDGEEDDEEEVEGDEELI